jgi:hypothetical protein
MRRWVSWLMRVLKLWIVSGERPEEVFVGSMVFVRMVCLASAF